MTLKYIGKGAWVPPYPARDLNDQEVKEFGEAELLATGLYEAEKQPAKKSESKPTPTKEGEQWHQSAA